MKDSVDQNQGREFFIKILSEKGYISKWVSCAANKLDGHKNRDNALFKQAEDYVQDVIIKILSLENFPEREPEDINKFVCGFIRKEISYELRQAPRIVPISKWEDNDDEKDEGERIENELVPKNLIEDFDDPFEVKAEKMDTEELMKICYSLLEKKPAEWLIIFDERSKNHPNREIAIYLHIDVEEVEKIWKRIKRLIRKNVPKIGKVFFLRREGCVKMTG